MSGGVNHGADRDHAGSAAGMGRRLRAMHRAVLSAAEGAFYVQTTNLSPKAKKLIRAHRRKEKGYQNEKSGSY